MYVSYRDSLPLSCLTFRHPSHPLSFPNNQYLFPNFQRANRNENSQPRQAHDYKTNRPNKWLSPTTLTPQPYTTPLP
ncbi:hypothetical protein VTJ04DRAFT_4610 [Mycothermus thermophilus]|uniref:uncharacterized protein n=1 Tax=Humicola insolens TaxID=85995 RepID=UPI0037434DD7